MICITVTRAYMAVITLTLTHRYAHRQLHPPTQRHVEVTMNTAEAAAAVATNTAAMTLLLLLKA